MCISLSISLHGTYQVLLCLVIAFFLSAVLKLVTYKYLDLISKTTKVTDSLVTPSYSLFCDTLWFCLEFLNCRTQSALSWFQYFEHKHLVYWIVNLALWSLEDVSLLNTCLLLVSRCLNWFLSKGFQKIRQKKEEVWRIISHIITKGGLIFDSLKVFMQQEVRSFEVRCCPLVELNPETGKSLA